LLAREALGKITDDKLTKDPSVIWARNKILEYETFQNQVSRYSDSIPFTSTTCTYEQLYDVIRTRRSIRTFDDRMVPKSDIEKIVSVVNWAPASCNRQTVKVYIANSPEIIQKCISTNNGATCLGDFIPCFISFCADLRPYEMPQEMTLPILDAALGIQNCCLVAHSLGIGMTLLNWTHHTDEQATLLRKIMGIPPYFRIIANAVLGYPAQGAPLPARKSEQFTYTFIQDAITS
jgi:nitroreductase